jgi:hypothetical protein
MGPVLAIGLAFGGGGAATLTVGGMAVTSVSSAVAAVATTAAVGGLVAVTKAAMKDSDSDSDIEDYKKNYKKPITTTAASMNNNNNNNNNDIQKKIKDIIDEQCVDKVYEGVKKVTPEDHKSTIDGISNIHSAIDLMRQPTEFRVAKSLCEIGHHFEKN